MRPAVLLLAALRLGAQSVTFEHIAPILHEYCAPCHRPGEAAPFPLLTYEDVRKHASQIAAVTARRYMPPWLPDSGYGDFAGERRLTRDQIDLIARWVTSGALRGAAAPAPPHFTEGWQLGTPDLIVQMPEPYRLAAEGGDVFRNFVIPVNTAETRYVRAIELRPGNPRIVHHANILVDRRRILRQRDREDGQPGFAGMDVRPEARTDSFDPDSHFLFWKPGSVVQPVPDDMSWRLSPGTDMILNLHLQPSGKVETVQPVIGFYFTKQPPLRHPILLQLENDGAIDIPPYSSSFAASDRLKLPVDVDVLAIYPHAHYLGRHVEAWATLPDGSRVWLIRISDWDLNWQAVYTYRKPVHLPRGANLEMRITYDNSNGNPRNPGHPPQRVRAGPRSRDEMGHVWLQVLPQPQSREDLRVVLQEALMRRRLEKYSNDFMAHCNLGLVLEMRGHYEEAISHFQLALRAQPSSATARNGLAASLLGQGRLDDAVREFRAALGIDPTLANARLNLARALAKKGNRSAAAAEFEALLKIKPDQADAHAGLGLLYCMEGRDDDALPHLLTAIRLNADYVELRTNLGLLLARRGDRAGAIEAFQAALKLNPEDKTAWSNLARLRAQPAGTQ
jgi:Flp pilus assembly protein TadD